MGKNFSQESSEAFLNLAKSAEQKTRQRVLTDSFEKNFEEKTSFHLDSEKKKLVGTLPLLLNMGFCNKSA